MHPDKRPLIIGITGNIGSGKTTVSHYIEQFYLVYYADKIAHDVLNETEIIKVLSDKWGSVILDTDGAVNRSSIAEIVFGNKQDLQFLNQTIHPGVLSKMQSLIEEIDSEVLFFEVPLLFEAGLSVCFDYILLVTASRKERVTRIMKRDNLSLEEIDNRVASQLDDEFKLARSDFVITNNGSKEELIKQVDSILSSISNLPHKSVKNFVK